ncbi:hypothetical protein JXA47_11045 [Candidatus Sumerlaeota bacterium]|nr:hypothetical protein [Candidatus Sumerlaeota bacterium]
MRHSERPPLRIVRSSLLGLIGLIAAVMACSPGGGDPGAAFDRQLGALREARSSFEAMRLLQGLLRMDRDRARDAFLEFADDDRLMLRCAAVISLASDWIDDPAVEGSLRAFALDGTMPLIHREILLSMTRDHGFAWHGEAVALMLDQAAISCWEPNPDHGWR